MVPSPQEKPPTAPLAKLLSESPDPVILSKTGLVTLSDCQRAQMQIENRQAHTLFGVVTLFLLGNSLRIVLNIHEALTEYDVSTVTIQYIYWSRY